MHGVLVWICASLCFGRLRPGSVFATLPFPPASGWSLGNNGVQPVPKPVAVGAADDAKERVVLRVSGAGAEASQVACIYVR